MQSFTSLTNTVASALARLQPGTRELDKVSTAFLDGFQSLDVTGKDVQLARAHYGPMLVRGTDEFIGVSLLNTGAFQELKITDITGFLRRAHGFVPGTFVDVGANIGTHMIYALKVEGFASAIGIEPDADNFLLLLCNVLLNGLAARSRLVNAAASNADGVAELELAPRNYGDHRVRVRSHTPLKTFGEDQRQVREVPMQRFESIFAGEEIAWDRTLVWLDIQGHEGQIFDSLRRMPVGRRPRYLVTEFWPYGIDRAGGRSLYLDFMNSCQAVHDINSANWQAGEKVEFSALCETYDLMLAANTDVHHPATDLLCVI